MNPLVELLVMGTALAVPPLAGALLTGSRTTALLVGGLAVVMVIALGSPDHLVLTAPFIGGGMVLGWFLAKAKAEASTKAALAAQQAAIAMAEVDREAKAFNALLEKLSADIPHFVDCHIPEWEACGWIATTDEVEWLKRRTAVVGLVRKLLSLGRTLPDDERQAIEGELAQLARSGAFASSVGMLRVCQDIPCKLAADKLVPQDFADTFYVRVDAQEVAKRIAEPVAAE